MKKLVLSMITLIFVYANIYAQGNPKNSALENAVAKLDKATKAKEFEALEKEFAGIAAKDAKNWLPYYYAAFCNAKIGFLNQDDGENIEPFSNAAEGQIRTAKSLLDTLQQKKELSELYTVLSMVYRTKVFINPMTYGRKYGPISQQYRIKAQALNPENPRAMYVNAWELCKTPRLWGGNKDKGKELATKSLSLLKDVKAGVYPHWGRAENQELLK